MEASSGRFRVRPIVVDFLGTLFITFCIGVTTAVVLGACVVLMAGEARGAAQVGELAPMKASEARQGALLFKSDPTGETFAAPLLSTDVAAMREGAPSEETREQVLELALTHHLVTKYTSLVAIDRTPARPVDADLKIAALPTNLPEGWNTDALFGPRETDFALVGRLPQGATDSRFNLLSGALALLFATLLFRLAQARRRVRLRLLRLREALKAARP